MEHLLTIDAQRTMLLNCLGSVNRNGLYEKKERGSTKLGGW